MRANQLPSERELTEGRKPRSGQTKTAEQILRLAVRTAEFLVGEDIVERDHFLTMKLGEGIYRLPHFPVKNVQINEMVPKSFEIDGESGVLHLILPEQAYTVSYRTGFEQSLIPAVYKELVLRLGRYVFSGSEEDRIEIVGLINTARRLRSEVEEVRRAIEVDGEIESQGPPGCS